MKGLVDYGSESDEDDASPLISAAPSINQPVATPAITSNAPLKLSALQKLNDQSGKQSIRHFDPFAISLLDPTLDADDEEDEEVDQSGSSAAPIRPPTSAQSVSQSTSQSTNERSSLPSPSQLLSGLSKSADSQSMNQSVKSSIPTSLDDASADADIEVIASQATIQSITRFVPLQVASKRSNVNLEDHAGFNREKRLKTTR